MKFLCCYLDKLDKGMAVSRSALGLSIREPVIEVNAKDKQGAEGDKIRIR
jgi:hypothetical protein